MSDDEIPTLGIVLQDPASGRSLYGPPVDGPVFWSWYEVIKVWGIEQAHRMAILSAEVIMGELSQQEKDRQRKILESIRWRGGISKDRRDQALKTSYEMLQRGEWKRPQAAEFAQWMLDKKNIQPEAWRKAVNKWAEENGQPKLDLPHGRPSRKKPE